ncbi:MAG TPA: hypothetical protein ENI95_09670 [Chloroflexi bacterium]|nr:hypothetical protein [Chloroflexota bacterium]
MRHTLRLPENAERALALGSVLMMAALALACNLPGLASETAQPEPITGGGTPPPTPEQGPPVEATVIALGGVEGTIRPLLGVNAGPVGIRERDTDITAGYQAVGVNSVRTHDYYGPLDMATMYPDQSASPDDPASYDFEVSDEVFRAIIAGGFEPYFRLGDSWSNASDFPPADPRHPTEPDHWVRAAVEVVRHYNDPALWGGSYVRRVEIWNEPDGRFWDASMEEFFDLFARTAFALKAEFPDLQVGGPGWTPAGYLAPRGQENVIAFLEYMSERDVPLDFLSWHVYSDDPDVSAEAAAFYRQLLDRYGYTETESHLSEWNTELGGGNAPALPTPIRAVYVTAIWINLQKEAVDAAHFYRGDMMFGPEGEGNQIASVFALWHEMSGYPERLSVTLDGEGEGVLYVLAGQNAEGATALLIANPTDEVHLWRVALPGGQPLEGHAISVREVTPEQSEAVEQEVEGPLIGIGPMSTQLVIVSP